MVMFGARSSNFYGVCKLLKYVRIIKIFILTSPLYAKAASGKDPDSAQLSAIRSQIQDTYRLLSERVHGKYAFLQSTTSVSNNLLSNFSELVLVSIKNLICLGLIIAKNSCKEIVKSIPSVEKYCDG